MADRAWGIVSVFFCYVVVLAVGIYSARRRRRLVHEDSRSPEEVMLAGRSIGIIVGIFTMTATYISGGVLTGAMEKIYTEGIVHCQAPVAYTLSLVVGGILFAHRMRARGYVTMLDPFHQKYGRRMCAIMFLPSLFSGIFWTASALFALGTSISVVTRLNKTVAIVISACTALTYTMLGGLISVAHTDIIQLIAVFAGVFVALPYTLMNEHVSINWNSTAPWIGNVEKHTWGKYIDTFLMIMLGGIPCQDYFQRVLSSNTPRNAVLVSLLGALGCTVIIVPLLIMGIAGKSADWESTDYNASISDDKANLMLALILQYLTPNVVCFIGIGAVSAAVMSSTDSNLLGTSTLVAHNLWKTLIRPKASSTEMLWVMRISMLLVAIISGIIACTTESIYGLLIVAAELLYVVQFPELVSVLYVDFSNTYGAISGFIVGVVLRGLAGEESLKIPAAIRFPGYVRTNDQMFPIRTFSMVITFMAIVAVSFITHWAFVNNHVNRRYDVFRCFRASNRGSGEIIKDNESKHGGSTESQLSNSQMNMRL
ncbi:hypothetical protein ACOME3_004805 [Neoechinorhynchus agilis]